MFGDDGGGLSIIRYVQNFQSVIQAQNFGFSIPASELYILSGSPSLRTIYSFRFSHPSNSLFYQVLPSFKLSILSGSPILQTLYYIRFSQPPNFIFYQVFPASELYILSGFPSLRTLYSIRFS